jgi:hypothetical protein
MDPPGDDDDDCGAASCAVRARALLRALPGSAQWRYGSFGRATSLRAVEWRAQRLSKAVRSCARIKLLDRLLVLGIGDGHCC